MNQSYRQNSHYLYLILAILGGGYTYFNMFLGILEHKGNFNVIAFIQSTWTENYYAKSITIDFWTGAIAGTFFVVFEGVRLKMTRVWLYPLLIVFVAFAFGFPLFLFFRSRYLMSKKR
jgi:hypothetical protein